MNNFVAGLVVGAYAGLLLLAYVADSNGMHYTNKTIVSHGCAHYDSQTGKFKWNE